MAHSSALFDRLEPLFLTAYSPKRCRHFVPPIRLTSSIFNKPRANNATSACHCQKIARFECRRQGELVRVSAPQMPAAAQSLEFRGQTGRSLGRSESSLRLREELSVRLRLRPIRRCAQLRTSEDPKFGLIPPDASIQILQSFPTATDQSRRDSENLTMM